MELKLATYEQAKKLKELGFPQEDTEYIYYQGELILESEIYFGGPATFELNDDDCISAPYLELAAKWLREEKKLNIEPRYQPITDTYMCFVVKYEAGPMMLIEEKTGVIKFNTYEEALSMGIDKAITQLNNNK